MDVIKLDVLNVLYAYGVFLLAYIANMIFSLYYNIKKERQEFSWNVMRDSIQKALIILAGTILLVIAVDMAMLYFSLYIPELKEKLSEVLSVLLIVIIIGRAAIKYCVEAYGTFTNILNGKANENADGSLNKE